MHNVSWQVIPFTHNANEERIFATITNRSFQVKFIVMVSSCTRTIGKLKEIWEREMVNTENYLITLNQRLKIPSASLVFSILISYNGVRNSFHHVSALKRVAKLFVQPFLEPQMIKDISGLNQVQAPNRSRLLKYRPDQ